jgi:dTDP-4-dehydrorhamnose 3,5-epimerase-like enzyme
LPASNSAAANGDLAQLRVRGVTLTRLPRFADERGGLTFGEVGQHFPFMVSRYFVVSDVPSVKVRGEHAHRECHEFLVCLRGSCAITLDDGQNREEVVLDSQTIGMYVPPMVWSSLYHYTPDAILLVLTSDPYSAEDYIRDYDDFLRAVRT